MSYIYLLCLYLVYLLEGYHCLQLALGWEYLNLYCRDTKNEPVDWWYIYKPPGDVGPGLDSGMNFTYITPGQVGRWIPSDDHILSESMLRYTIDPMFNREYADYMGIVVYEEKEPRRDFKGSSALGIMMANTMGGLWIGHTVPGFPDLLQKGPSFPPEEIKKGHMMMCLTLDLATLNLIATAIKQTEPYIQKMKIPETLKEYLPDWANLLSPLGVKTSRTSVRKTKVLHFMTKEKTLRGMMYARSPGDSRCLYKSFAKTKSVVMDVYGHKERHGVLCDKKYSVRNINSISLKFPERVYYINNSSDSMGFAVTTGAQWQRQGSSKKQFWACTGNIENQPRSSKGGIITCVNNFKIWLTFDNLKVKEPDCVF